MKKIVLFIIAFSLCLGAKAQEKSKSTPSEQTEKGVSVSFMGGINVSTMMVKVNDERALSDKRIGFQAGVNVDVPLKRDFYFRSGLVLAQKGLKTEGVMAEGIFTRDVKITGTPCYLEIPLLASYKRNLNSKVGVQLSTGPYLAYGLIGKLKWRPVGSYEVSTVSVDWFGGEEDMETAQKKRFDTGWHIGSALVFKGSISIGYAFEAGFINSTRVDGTSLKTRCHMINLSFKLY